MKFNLPSRGTLLFSLLIIAAFSCDNEKDPVDANHSVRPGDFLAATDYKSITVEIVYVDGFQPTTAAVQNLQAFLAARLNKPSGINVVQREVPSSGATVMSVDKLKEIETTQRGENTSGTRITAYFYFSDAEYSGNSGSAKVLGVAYDYSSMAIFENSVREFSGGVGEPAVATLESTVILHEFAHILGLVNNGTPIQAQHQDGAHGAHCSNQDCLMYYLAETSGIAGNLLGGSVPALDATCIADLQGNGGK